MNYLCTTFVHNSTHTSADLNVGQMQTSYYVLSLIFTRLCKLQLRSLYFCSVCFFVLGVDGTFFGRLPVQEIGHGERLRNDLFCVNLRQVGCTTFNLLQELEVGRVKRQVSRFCRWMGDRIGYRCDGPAERWTWRQLNRLRGVTDCNSLCRKQGPYSLLGVRQFFGARQS